MKNKILNQLDEYMKYNKLENHPMHKTLKDAFIQENFSNIYIDDRLYPVLYQQIWLLLVELKKLTGKSMFELKIFNF